MSASRIGASVAGLNVTRVSAAPKPAQKPLAAGDGFTPARRAPVQLSAPIEVPDVHAIVEGLKKSAAEPIPAPANPWVAPAPSEVPAGSGTGEPVDGDDGGGLDGWLSRNVPGYQETKDFFNSFAITRPISELKPGESFTLELSGKVKAGKEAKAGAASSVEVTKNDDGSYTVAVEVEASADVDVGKKDSGASVSAKGKVRVEYKVNSPEEAAELARGLALGDVATQAKIVQQYKGNISAVEVSGTAGASLAVELGIPGVGGSVGVEGTATRRYEYEQGKLKAVVVRYEAELKVDADSKLGFDPEKLGIRLGEGEVSAKQTVEERYPVDDDGNVADQPSEVTKTTTLEQKLGDQTIEVKVEGDPPEVSIEKWREEGPDIDIDLPGGELEYKQVTKKHDDRPPQYPVPPPGEKSGFEPDAGEGMSGGGGGNARGW